MVAFVSPPPIRIDDRVETVLAVDTAEAGAALSVWRQAADLLAQRRVDPDSRSERALLARLHLLAPRIDRGTRREVAAVAGFGSPAPALVALLARDEPRIAEAVLSRTTLAAVEWATLVPDLGPVGRGILRGRRDLPAGTVRLLASFGPADRLLGASDAAQAEGERLATLPPPEADAQPEPQPHTRPSQIADLVARIDAYRQARPAHAEPASIEVSEASPAEQPVPIATVIDPARFAFALDRDGIVVGCDAHPRETLIGLSFALPANAGESGVDAAAAASFRRRTGFREARLTIAGDGPLAGDWQVSATPRFVAVDGRFQGYDGHARRARPDERARPGGTGVRPDALRQLAHELRTPINAIAGFAQMIERQMLGPVGQAYRDRALSIAGQAERLLAAVEDLDIVARIETGALVVEPEAIDLAAIVRHAVAELAGLAAARAVTIAPAGLDAKAVATIDARGGARAITRLLGAAIAVAEGGETIGVALSRDGAVLRIAVDRPAALAGLEPAALLQVDALPASLVDADAVAQLGFGFALRLVANLARELGGRLEAQDAGCLTICLPATDYTRDQRSQQD